MFPSGARKRRGAEQGASATSAATAVRGVSPYEVRCPKCRVSFPIGTRTCFHCGGRTAPSETAPALGWSSLRQTTGASGAPGSGAAEPESPWALEQAEAEEAAAPASPARLLVTLLWVGLAIGFSLIRACSER